MGTEQTMESLGKKIKFLREIELVHFGKVNLFEDEITRDQYFCTSFEFLLHPQTEVQFARNLLRQNNQCPQLVGMLQVDSIPPEICTNSQTIKIYFEYLPTSLQDLLDNSQKPLSEIEVRLLMTNLFEAVKFLNSKQTHHGDISPEFIYLSKRGKRRYQIFDSSYFEPNRHGYYRALKEKTYCSPEILSNVCDKRLSPNFNHEISDTFSIGLIALYCTTLISPLMAYRNNREIDFYYIEMLLRLCLRNGYSSQLVQCISTCVRLRNRPTATEILADFVCLSVDSRDTKLSLRK